MQAVQPAQQVEEAVRRAAGQQVAAGGELAPGGELPGEEGERRDRAGGEAEPHRVAISLADGGERALQGDASQHQHEGVPPHDAGHRHRLPVAELLAHEVGAGEKREERPDHRQEDAERDLLGRHSRRPGPADGVRPDLEPRLRHQPLVRQPPAGEAEHDQEEDEDHAHCWTGRFGQGSSWAMKSCGAPGTL
jgi:hypothetical protein